MLEHHCTVRKQKPPDGKNPWVERLGDGDYAIRPLYLRSQRRRISTSVPYEITLVLLPRFEIGADMKRTEKLRPGYGKILDAWGPPENAGEPIGCVATSFTFDRVLRGGVP